MDKNKNILIIGAGPSGLALAYELIQLKSDIKPVIIDKLPVVGGLSRTIYDESSGIDIGGHRFITKDKYIKSIWFKFLDVQGAPSMDDILAGRNVFYPKCGKDPNVSDDVFLIRRWFSSIIQNNIKYKFPIVFNFDTLKKLGLKSSLIAIFDYLKSLCFTSNPNNLEDFLISRFGFFLYNMFFKKHIEKIWGLEPSEIIHELDNKKIQKNIFSPLKFWEDKYYYPKYGCSQLWNKMAQYIIDNGGTIILNCNFLDFKFSDNKLISAVVECDNMVREISAKYFASSIPLSDLIKALDAPFDVKQNALNLKYRDYISVSFYTNNFNIVNNKKFKTYRNIAPENRIYLQNDKTCSSRLQIMNNLSPYLIDDFKNNFIISLEYFCSVGDYIWNLSDDKLIEFAYNDVLNYGLFDKNNVYKTKVIREQKAYPIYCGNYKYIDKIRNYIKQIPNLYIMGSNGEHKYINMDSAMVCGINIAREINKKG